MPSPTSPSAGYVTDVAYLPGYYPFMAPARMRYVASLQGIRPPAVREGFDFLELGCGFGSTLLTLAAANPQGRFTGVDFMPVHTDHIAREVAATGLRNVRVLCADFANMPADLPAFDFIALHGVFSWVSPELRACVLEIIRRHLKPDGIVEVTYNCMPGWSSLLPHWTVFHAAEVLAMFGSIGLGHAGRLPYHHNHWELCAKPHFAGQFQGADLATVETLKDHHANVMFRWDLFSRRQREAWTPRQRAEAAGDLFFRIALPQASLPHTVTYGGVTAGIAGPPHDRMLEAMGHSSWSLPMLLDEPQLAEFTAESLVEAVDAGVAMGLFRVDGGPAIDPVPPVETIATASLAVPLEFNRRALERKDLANEQVGLASLRTGAGHEIGDLHAVILDELVTGGRGGIEQRIADRLARTEKHLREHTTGRPITDPAERAKAVGAICGGFFATVLPELVRQGIAVWDRDQAVGKAL
ncbi:MAG: class I SAM-dependent methyltransferase [Planctomycetaceae bacterium]|nr:class I SAM-dependent methyltransferase [Planctomycetaceae bacterium]